jgi:outer membrane protein OmpA-like peptidoglycan-associated protein
MSAPGILGALLTVTLGAGVLGWWDLFHLVVGAIVLAGVTAVTVAWRRRTALDEEGAPIEEEERDAWGPSLVLGAVGGGVLLVVLAGSFAAAERTPLAQLHNADCAIVKTKARILAEGGAHEHVLRTLEARLMQPASPGCRADLEGARVDALLTLATMPGQDPQQRLQQARGAALAANRVNLVALVDARMEAARQALEVESQRKTIDEQQAQNRRLIQALHRAGLTARETTEGIVTTLPDVLFEPGSAILAASADEIVLQVCQLVAANGERHVSVDGYTDSTGTEAGNRALSEARARAVADRLAACGVAPERLGSQGHGRHRPVAPNETAAGRARNRRVEIVLKY